MKTKMKTILLVALMFGTLIGYATEKKSFTESIGKSRI